MLGPFMNDAAMLPEKQGITPTATHRRPIPRCSAPSDGRDTEFEREHAVPRQNRPLRSRMQPCRARRWR